MGVHTGDSITVAPALTLTDPEYQRMREAAKAIMRGVGVETGGSNVQFALNPEDGRIIVIEMNPRVSRSSALASKATGFPIARIAAKLAVGYTLDELENDITGTSAAFEPAIDYVVVKWPRFAFEKFPGADGTLGTQMKSVGEVMSIGRTFCEALQKAARSLETGKDGLVSLLDKVDYRPLAAPKKRRDLAMDAPEPEPPRTLPPPSPTEQLEALRALVPVPSAERLFQVADAMRLGMTEEARRGEREHHEQRQAPELEGQAEQRRRRLGAGRGDLEHPGPERLEPQRRDQLVGEGEVAREGLGGDLVLVDRRHRAAAGEQRRDHVEPDAQAPRRRERGRECDDADQHEEQALQDAPRARPHAEAVLREQRPGDGQRAGAGHRQRHEPRGLPCERGIHATSAMTSISTHAPSGICATPKALRACAPLSPKTSASSSEQPLVTRCCSVNSGVLLTRLMTLTMRVMFSRSPTAACSVPISSIAIARAACLPVAVSMSRPSWPTQGLPSRRAMCPETKTRLPVRTKGT